MRAFLFFLFIPIWTWSVRVDGHRKGANLTLTLRKAHRWKKFGLFLWIPGHIDPFKD